MTRTNASDWARMGMPAEWVAEHLPRCEARADASGKTGPAWTACVRGELWKFWRARWRDERTVLEEAQRRIERRGARKASSTVDVGEALRRMLEPR